MTVGISTTSRCCSALPSSVAAAVPGRKLTSASFAGNGNCGPELTLTPLRKYSWDGLPEDITPVCASTHCLDARVVPDIDSSGSSTSPYALFSVVVMELDEAAAE